MELAGDGYTNRDREDRQGVSAVIADGAVGLTLDGVIIDIDIAVTQTNVWGDRNASGSLEGISTGDTNAQVARVKRGLELIDTSIRETSPTTENWPTE